MKLSLFLGRHIVAVSLVALAAMVTPIVLTTVISHVPFRALMLGFWWPAFLGIAPSAVYIILPAAVGVGVAWTYTAFASEGIIAVMYSSRMSVARLCRPAIVVAMAGTVICYAFSAWIAPATSKNIHDTIFTIQNNLDPRLLEEGRFYNISDGQSSISFERWLDTWEVEKIFIREKFRDGTERLIVADRGVFIKKDDDLFILLKRGRVHSMVPRSGSSSSAEFDQIAQPMGANGTTKINKRQWKGVYEMGHEEFMAYEKKPNLSAQDRRHWASEVVKRFIVPLMTLSHSLLGLGMVLTFGPLTGRRGLNTAVVAVSIILLHAGSISLSEFVATATVYSPGVMLLFVICEALLGLALIVRQQVGHWSLRQMDVRLLQRSSS